MAITKDRNIIISIITISFFCWLLLFFNLIQNSEGHSCHLSHDNSDNASLTSLMIGWYLMVLAMMLPKLIVPIRHIHSRSLKRNRISSIFLFVLGYSIIWFVVGYILNLIMIFFYSNSHQFYLLVIIGLISLIYQFSPLKQYFLNLGHNHRSIKPMGLGSFKDVFNFGVEHGIYCVGAGWAIMWFPMLLPIGHNIAMIIVMLIMISEHMEHPKKPEWSLDGRFKLFRIIKAQIKFKINAM